MAKQSGNIEYPTFDAIRAEDREEKPYLLFTVKDEAGEVVRRLKSDSERKVTIV